MLSRVAENLYWISRYVERIETVARLLDEGLQSELGTTGIANSDQAGGPLLRILEVFKCTSSFRDRYSVADRQRILRFLAFDRDHPDSIAVMLDRARENARGTQETLSAETWGQINRLYLYLGSKTAHRRFRSSPSRFFEGIKRACILFNGLVDATLPRTEVYHFLRLGRYLERVILMSCVLRVMIDTFSKTDSMAGGPIRIVSCTSLLQACSAYDAYIRQSHEQIEPRRVVGFLLLDPDFPRSMRFGVDRCCDSLAWISVGESDGWNSQAERLLGRLGSDLRFVDIDELVRQGLDTFVGEVEQVGQTVAFELYQAFFKT